MSVLSVDCDPTLAIGDHPLTAHAGECRISSRERAPLPFRGGVHPGIVADDAETFRRLDTAIMVEETKGRISIMVGRDICARLCALAFRPASSRAVRRKPAVHLDDSDSGGLDASLNAVSRPIKVLEGAGLVGCRTERRDRIITADPRSVAAIQAWLATLRNNWEARLGSLACLFEKENDDDD